MSARSLISRGLRLVLPSLRIQSASRVAARDSDIARLRTQNAHLKDNLAKVIYDLQSANMIDCDPTAPSYRAHVYRLRRQWAPIEEAAGTLLPARLLGSKIITREIVNKSGIAVHMPAQLGSWRSVHDVEFDALPDAVVG